MEHKVKTNAFVKIFITLLLCIFAAAINRSGVNTIIAIVFWGTGFAYSLQDIKNKFALFSFEVGFFVFILSGFAISFLKTGGFSYFSHSNQTILHTTLSVCLSLGIINAVVFLLHERAQNENTDKSNDGQVTANISNAYKLFLVVMLVFSFICQTVETVIETTYKLSTSYIADTTEVLSRLPSFVIHGASYYYIVLFLYLSTFPSKKKTITSLASGVIIAFMTLISGRRGEPIALMLAIAYYIIIRNKKGVHDITIKKKHVFALVVLLPFFVIFLYQLGYSRMGRESSTSNSLEALDNFFEEQGGSVRIIANGYDERDRITAIGGRTFLLGEFRNYLKNNIFTHILLGTKTGTRAERALTGDQYSATYNYLVLSDTTFDNGIGSGTTYIAEAYHDGGYFALAIISIYIGILLSKLDRPYKYDSPILTGIYLNIMRYMPVLPRGYAFAWLTNTFALQNLMLFLVCFILQNTERNDTIKDDAT